MPLRDEGQGLAYGKIGRRASEADRILEMRIMGREVVVALPNGRLPLD
jgi:hypothetical protein